jgi:hypothetical protein
MAAMGVGGQFEVAGCGCDVAFLVLLFLVLLMPVLVPAREN